MQSNLLLDFPGGAVVKNPPANAGDARDVGLIFGSGRSLEEEVGNPLWYSCWENSMDRGAWLATVLGVTKKQLNDWAHTQMFYHWLISTKTVWIKSAKWLCHDSSWRVFHFIKYFGIMLLLISIKHLNCTLLETLKTGASLMAQWWRICQPMQETWVWSLVQEDPTYCGAAEPVHQDYWPCALEPRNGSYWAHMLQLLKPALSRAHAMWQETLL